MSTKIYDLDTPSIKIYRSINVCDHRFKEVLWGIEEEEIPYTVEYVNLKNTNILGSMAACDSKLSVGIGISEDRIILTTNKLDKEEPLFYLRLDEKDEILRKLGSNAARLVKGIAFK